MLFIHVFFIILIYLGLQHKPPLANGSDFSSESAPTPSMSDNKAKNVLKEAVDAVVNSFAKHTHGYGRG